MTKKEMVQTEDEKMPGKARGIYGEGSTYQRKDGRYVSKVRLPNGKRIECYGKTRREAKEKLKKAVRAFEDGTLLTERGQTVAAYLDYWLEMRRNSLTIRLSTYASYHSYIHNHIAPAIGEIALQRLTGSQIQLMYTQFKKDGLSPNTIHLVHTILKAALNDAVKWRKISINPCTELTPPRLQRRKMKYITQEQAIKLIAAAKGYRIETILLLAVSLGLRRGELLGLHWEDVNFEEGTLQVQRTVSYVPTEESRMHTYLETDPKTETSKRTIILPAFVLNALRAHRAQQIQERLRAGSSWKHDTLVFCSMRGGYINATSLRDQFKSMLKKAGLPDMRFHDLRHSAATILLAMGINIKVIQELLGHADISITLGLYAHVTPAMHQEAMKALDASFRQLREQHG